MYQTITTPCQSQTHNNNAAIRSKNSTRFSSSYTPLVPKIISHAHRTQPPSILLIPPTRPSSINYPPLLFTLSSLLYPLWASQDNTGEALIVEASRINSQMFFFSASNVIPNVINTHHIRYQFLRAWRVHAVVVSNNDSLLFNF